MISATDKTRKEWQTELFKDLFGKYPLGHIEINIVFGGLYFRVYDIEDYVLAYTGGENNNNTILESYKLEVFWVYSEYNVTWNGTAINRNWTAYYR